MNYADAYNSHDVHIKLLLSIINFFRFILLPGAVVGVQESRERGRNSEILI